MFQPLLEMIEGHATYGPAMKQAVAAGEAIIIDYHTHGPGSGYCIAIHARHVVPVKLLSFDAELEELVHVRGFGKTEEECLPLTSAFATALASHYDIDEPEIYLNGEPFTG